jgi:4-hydroxy-tetrahydrodipicolinate reductase
MIRVLVNGAAGKMGLETVKALEADSNFSVCGQTGHDDDLSTAIAKYQPQVVVDFTTPDSVFSNAKKIIEHNIHPVIGTTGLTEKQIQELQNLSAEKKLGGIIAPNFSLAAVLMMRFAGEAARYFNHVEIIEYHHDKKKDAPSGTALKTAEMIAKVINEVPPQYRELIPGAKGAYYHGIPVHSVRMPGVMANQQVIFGCLGETLTIKHDTIDRQCFMPGVLLACKKVFELDTLVYGLENILFED